MIAVDTSSLIAYLSGGDGVDVNAVEVAFAEKQAVLPPVVLAELLSDPALPLAVARLFEQIPLLALTEGYWERVGRLRARLLGRRRKARLADALIAQSCLDHDTALVTRDRDFRHFAQLARLKLATSI